MKSFPLTLRSRAHGLDLGHISCVEILNIRQSRFVGYTTILQVSQVNDTTTRAENLNTVILGETMVRCDTLAATRLVAL